MGNFHWDEVVNSINQSQPHLYRQSPAEQKEATDYGNADGDKDDSVDADGEDNRHFQDKERN